MRSALLALLLLLPSAASAAFELRGVCYDADWENRTNWYGTPASAEQLRRLKKIGVNAISFTPFAHQEDVRRPDIRFRPELDRGMETDIRLAKELGMMVVLKPHIWSNQFWDGSGEWHGTIEMPTEKDWAAWFANYEKMIVHFARLAAKNNVDGFVIGLEYRKTTQRTEDWRRIIRAVRKEFPRAITYAAHDMSEAEQIQFWPDLDVIGVNAYFPIAETSKPTLNDLRAGWRKHAEKLEAFSMRLNRAVVLTEIGYASVDGAAQRPFEWPKADSVSDESEQALSYQAMLETLWDKPWMKGIFIWKFKVGVTAADRSREPSEYYFVFQDKPAEKVISTYFLQK